MLRYSVKMLVVVGAVLAVIVLELIFIDRKRSSRNRPRRPRPQMVALSHNIVKDRQSDLQWLRCNPRRSRRNGHCPPIGPLSWSKAVDYCDRLSYAGHSDWRLPTEEELLEVISCDYRSFTRCEILFPDNAELPRHCLKKEGSREAIYWSATGPRPCYSRGQDGTEKVEQCARAIRYNRTNCGRDNGKSGLYRIHERHRLRCVRGNPKEARISP